MTREQKRHVLRWLKAKSGGWVCGASSWKAEADARRSVRAQQPNEVILVYDVAVSLGDFSAQAIQNAAG